MRKDNKTNKIIFILLIILVVLLGDLLSKHIIREKLKEGQYVVVIPNFFHLHHIKNSGGAFGFLTNYNIPKKNILFITLSSLAFLIILVFLINSIKQNSYLYILGLSLITGGALGNLVDRIIFGEVTDFLDFFVNDFHWPTFNIADTSITLGVIIVAFYILFLESKAKKKNETVNLLT